MKVLITDKLDERGIEILKEGGLDVDVATNLSPEGLKQKIKGYDALIVRSKTKVTKEIVDSSDILKMIGRAGVGVDNIDVDVATKKGIVVMNAPTGNTISAAEHTFGMLLALSRNIPQAYFSMRQKKWEKGKFSGTEVYGKTLGIIGLGRVGMHLAKIAKGAGMKIIGNDPFITKEKCEAMGIELVELKELLKNSDYLSLHIPLTLQTHHLIGEEEFGMMKKNLRIIKCARGGVIDEDALYKALTDGRIAGAALDVFEEEPPSHLPFLQLDNVIFTPHLGASTFEAERNVTLDIAEAIKEALMKGIYKNAVNIPSIDTTEWQNLKPYFLLGEKMGRFSGQILEGSIRELKIGYNGEVASLNLSLISSSFLKGLLQPVFSDTINYVNAMMLAEERGIKITEDRSKETKGFTSMISVEIRTDKGVNKMSGVLFGKTYPRIVSIDEYGVEIVPEGHILICYNDDKPGFIGKIGSILGEEGINIGSMSYGRKSLGGEAITVLSLDSCLTKEAIERINSIKETKKIKIVEL